MKKWALRLTFALVACLTLSLAHAQSRATVSGKDSLEYAINSAIQHTNPYAKIGVAIKSMRRGDVLYTKNSHDLFVPASTLKIFTAEAALLYLGPNYQFPTRFVTNAKSVTGGKLYGNLYLVHSGDPSLTYNDLVVLMQNLKSQQINEIVGNVYIDNTAYDQVNTGPGWVWNDKKYCYGAPINASIINHNCLSFRARPQYNGQVTPLVKNSNSSIRHTVATKKRGSRSCYVRLDDNQGGSITINGCLSKGSRFAAGGSSVITDVVQYNKVMLTDLLQRYNIRVQGVITSGTAPLNATALATHHSKPLRQLITEMLKMSDNVIAGSIFKRIGASYNKRPGTWENGGEAVGRILSQQAALDIWHINLIDGSGLSRFNQVTPSQMLQLLDFAYHNNGTNYEFISALPIAGVDGTLKRRMRNLAWRVRAKTGTLQGVVSLAGYAISADKEPFAFVIMINGRNGSVWQYRELEDKIVSLLTHYTRTG